jgi:hypothetical protein
MHTKHRPDWEDLNSGLLIEFLVDICTERGLLIATDAPQEELASVQRKVDKIAAELHRRLAW